jgi:hypothetical protein
MSADAGRELDAVCIHADIGKTIRFRIVLATHVLE